jgi:signal peptidase I
MVPTIPAGADVAVSTLDHAPARGNVVVFRFPGQGDSRYVKRIVGLAGDTITESGPDILVNGKPIPRCHVGAWSYAEVDGGLRNGELWLEALDGAKWLVFHEATPSGAPARGPWTVGAGEVFVMGDNRERSYDSRVWFGGKGGGLPLFAIVGTVTGVDAPVVPRGAELLKPALDQCEASLSK